MTHTVKGIFYKPEDAERAVADLLAHGFPREQIGLIGAGSAEATHVKVLGSGVEHAEDLAIGAVGGGLLGGALGALVGMIVVGIPGIGPVLLAGPLAVAFGGAGASMVAGAGLGAVGGGVLGALAWAGISGDEAHVYEEFLRRGGTLVMVRASEAGCAAAAEILGRDGAADRADIHAEWSREGLV